MKKSTTMSAQDKKFTRSTRGSISRSSSSAPADIEVPTKLRRASSSTKKDEDKSKERDASEASDEENPIPKSHLSRKDIKSKNTLLSDAMAIPDSGEKEPIPKRKFSKAKKTVGFDSDEEEPIPRTRSGPVPKKRSTNTNKTIYDGSDSDEEGPTPKKKSKEWKKDSKKVDNFRKPLPPTNTPKRGSSNHRTPDKPKQFSTDSASELTPEEKKRGQQASYSKHISGGRGAPEHLGAKEIPIGARDCLTGLTFVLAGVLNYLGRDDVTQIVSKYGGRVTGSVSGKTTHLIVGIKPRESHIKKANDLKIPKISEDDFLDILRKSNSNQPDSQTVFECPSDEEDLSDTDVRVLSIKMPVKVSSSQDSGVGSSQSQSVLTPQSTTPKIKTKPMREETESKPTTRDEPGGIWVDKYSPKTLKNVVGQTGDRSNAQLLISWLQNWFQYHGHAGEKVKSKWPGLKDPEGTTFKAALLSGVPGIGKTSTAHLACKQIGYDFFELNASDTRNKKGLHKIASDALTSKSIVQIGTYNELTSKHVLIMDEVDGMSGNEDRGGIQELIALIKTSRVPVICICNDRYHQKIRSLANYCFDLRFNKPSDTQIKGFIQSVCFKEKLRLPVESAEQLIYSTDHDIRQSLNQLELLEVLKECNSLEQICDPRKDLKFGPWDVVRKVFSASEHVGMSINDKSNLFFQDYSFGPLFVQENYLKWTPTNYVKWRPLKTRGNKYKTLDWVTLSAEAIATGDLVDNLIHRSNDWSLLPTQAIFSSILPGEYMEGNNIARTEFPRWLGKISHRNKMSRLLQQLHNHVHLEVSGSLEALNLDYLPYLRRSIVNPLGTGDVRTALEGMQNYSLVREDFDTINELGLWPGMQNPLEKLNPQTKAAFTRQVNKEVMAPYSVNKGTKGKAKAEASEDLEGLKDDVNEEENEEDDKIESDAMIKSKKPKTGSIFKGDKFKVVALDDDDDEDDEVNPKQWTSKASSSSSSKRKTGQYGVQFSSKRGRK